MGKSTKPQAPLTELEGTVLATIAKEGRCTPYRVRDIFLRSPSEVWSGSAGAIYPLIDRLVGRGVLRSDAETVGKRPRKLLSLTAAGKRALKGWLLDVESGAGIGFDPMRSRLHAAELYEKTELRAYVRKAMTHMEQHIHPPRSDDPRVAEIHKIWLAHRKAATEEVLALLLAK